MEVPSESFCRSSWDSRTCYPWRATNQGLTDDWLAYRFLIPERQRLKAHRILMAVPFATLRLRLRYAPVTA